MSFFRNLLPRSSSLAGKGKSLSTLPSRHHLPELMLPPIFEKNKPFYQFYNIEKRIVSSISDEGSNLMNSKVVGSSHGWLALVNDDKPGVSLVNPYTGHRAELPPAPRGHRVQKLILSASPFNHGCRAVISYGPRSNLAFCIPGRCASWTPIGAPFRDSTGEEKPTVRSYKDFVFSADSGRLYCAITPTAEFESWDLVDPAKRKLCPIPAVYSCPENSPAMIRYKGGHDLYCSSHPSLVHHDGDLYYVIRFVADWYDPRSESAASSEGTWIGESSSYNMKLAYKTNEFVVYKLAKGDAVWKHMEGHLDGLSLFVGLNQGFAVKAEMTLMKNSIYFTDCMEPVEVDGLGGRKYGGHDFGVFDCATRKVASIYNDGEIKRIQPSPIWFTPHP